MSNIRVEMSGVAALMEVVTARLRGPDPVPIQQLRELRLAVTRAENELKCMGASGVKLEDGHYQATYPVPLTELNS